MVNFLSVAAMAHRLTNKLIHGRSVVVSVQAPASTLELRYHCWPACVAARFATAFTVNEYIEMLVPSGLIAAR